MRALCACHQVATAQPATMSKNSRCSNRARGESQRCIVSHRRSARGKWGEGTPGVTTRAGWEVDPTGWLPWNGSYCRAGCAPTVVAGRAFWRTPDHRSCCGRIEMGLTDPTPFNRHGGLRPVGDTASETHLVIALRQLREERGIHHAVGDAPRPDGDMRTVPRCPRRRISISNPSRLGGVCTMAAPRSPPMSRTTDPISLVPMLCSMVTAPPKPGLRRGSRTRCRACPGRGTSSDSAACHSPTDRYHHPSARSRPHRPPHLQ